MEALPVNLEEKVAIGNENEIKAESKYTIKSDKNTTFNIVLRKTASFIEINASYQDDKILNEYIQKYSLSNLKENKYLSLCDSIDEIYEELIFEFSKNKPIIIEKEDKINITIPVQHSKFKEINFTLNKKIKTDRELCQDLYALVSGLQK